jgi:hypothetical protein
MNSVSTKELLRSRRKRRVTVNSRLKGLAHPPLK